jgi:hypothetical protein
MKQVLWVAVAGLMFVGCGKIEEAPPAKSVAEVPKAFAAMEASKWAEALPFLQQLLASDLTASQRQAVQDALVQTQKGAAASAADKSLGDVKKSLPIGN